MVAWNVRGSCSFNTEEWPFAIRLCLKLAVSSAFLLLPTGKRDQYNRVEIYKLSSEFEL